jgi:hypothetical protein
MACASASRRSRFPTAGSEWRKARNAIQVSGPFAPIVAADVVRRPRCVHDAHEVELAALEGRRGLVRSGARDLDAGDVARMPPCVRLVSDEDEPFVAALELAERAAEDLAFGSRPVVAVAPDA